MPPTTVKPLPIYYSFYTQRWLLVESKGLGLLYWGAMASMVFWVFLQLLISNGFVDRYTPFISVNFWQDRAIDGNWWYQREKDSVPDYCGHRYYWGESTDWGSEEVACLDPESLPNSTFFYQDDEGFAIATSIAYGTEWASNDVRLYKDMEHVTVVFQPSLWTERETSDISGCTVYGSDGKKVPSRVLDLYPTRNKSSDVWQEREEYILISLEDILRSVNRSWDDIGGEKAKLRLQGIELVAHIDVRNYHKPFSPSDDLECTIRFAVLRDQFTLVKRFYERDSVVAVQHGLKMRIVTTGSIGYPSTRAFFETIVVGLGMLSLSQTIADFVAQFLHPKKTVINKACVDSLNLDEKKAVGKQD
eukprot:TRINITY_DN255_c3_g1_i1.p1 TRINITY_DN255_c3_g1~~TRINITY_DN255_c3_g1_i1.p1  ORF type:complete len:380 (+),score=59.59 TRINITY_DN255_c3_g1_i1:60-1142(+)